MILYRIEHKISCNGPFTHLAKARLYNASLCECPHPYDVDFIPEIHKFAVLRIELIHQYFKPILKSLDKSGFHIKKIEIPLQFVIVGEEQCAFEWRLGRTVKIYSIDESKKVMELA